MKKRCRFQSISHIFRSSVKISRVPVVRFWYKIAFWKLYELQIIWFKFRYKIYGISFSNLAPKLKFAENWKSKNGFSWITLKFQVICWDIYITVLKGYDAGFPKNSKFSINACFEKNFSGGSLCTKCAAGIWAVDLFSTTYFGEIIIFVVSKDHTFRIRCTLMNPEQFLILVTYLLLGRIHWKSKLKNFGAESFVLILKTPDPNTSKTLFCQYTLIFL